MAGSAAIFHAEENEISDTASIIIIKENQTTISNAMMTKKKLNISPFDAAEFFGR